MPNRSGALDRVFQALADPTRRAVLERLRAGPRATTRLARPFRMALPSFMQHLDVLERCGLVRSRKMGRIRAYEAAAPPLKAAETWIARQRAPRERRPLHRHRPPPERGGPPAARGHGIPRGMGQGA